MVLLPFYAGELKVAETCLSICNKVKMEKIWSHRLEIKSPGNSFFSVILGIICPS